MELAEARDCSDVRDPNCACAVLASIGVIRSSFSAADMAGRVARSSRDVSTVSAARDETNDNHIIIACIRPTVYKSDIQVKSNRRRCTKIGTMTYPGRPCPTPHGQRRVPAGTSVPRPVPGIAYVVYQHKINRPHSMYIEQEISTCWYISHGNNSFHTVSSENSMADSDNLKEKHHTACGCTRE